ncbi:MAG: hypothetical protein JRI23_11125 [Deltaproteobacteria bacterium]|jgi:hypothetical protein|nr:hypothetical protein [Deltaproteobacteria bacterium]MBW2532234.1 hypothetical protein [Deltaproteobacteria bacterium]
MRYSVDLRFVAAAALLVALNLGCGASTAPEHQTAAGAASPAPVGFGLEDRSVGTAADGLVLRSIRHAPHPGFFRMVFDIGLQEGRLADVAPAATARFRARDKSLELVIEGIRTDLTGNRPLRSESGEALGSPVPIDRPPVAWLARELVLDDAAVAYRIQLTREARFRLLALDRPARIVLDVEHTGGAKPAAHTAGSTPDR